jgi:hypothetical protein
MTLRMNVALAIFAGGVSLSVFGQGTFQNLDFEEANIGPNTGQPREVSVANALPGWTVDYTDAVHSFQETAIPINYLTLGGVTASIMANGYPSDTTLAPIDGNYSVLLSWGGQSEGSSELPAVASISQTGQIPLGTQSLLFAAQWYAPGPSSPDVSIGGDTLTLFPVGGGTGENGVSYTTWGANVSVWAGQTEQLTFSSGEGNLLLDDISFSPTAVIPEPDPLALMGLGGLLLAQYRRFGPKRQ